MYTGNYEYNLKQGYHFWYHFNGSLERFNYYDNHKKQGKEIVYHPDGSFKWIINYENNGIVGTCEFFKDIFENYQEFYSNLDYLYALQDY